jgi:hypothetical protein
VKVTITFEPESISTVMDVLTINGGASGEYKCTIQGLAKPPVPQVRSSHLATGR